MNAHADRRRTHTFWLTAAVLIALAGLAVEMATRPAEAEEGPVLTAAQPDEAALTAPLPPPAPPWPWFLAPLGCLGALATARTFYVRVRNASPGNETMQRIAGYVRQGAMAYLRQQYRVVAVVLVIIAGVLLLLSFFGLQYRPAFVGFLTAGFFSGLAGFFGMLTATMASSRTAQAASESLDAGLRVAFRAGAVMGLSVVGLALLDMSIWFTILTQVLPRVFDIHFSLNEVAIIMLSFAMGASTQALFARVGGGIYTKAADVGADLVGKVEAGIPEDDPRNPATIADNVGDNVGDVAGMGADLYESYVGSILSSAALGVAAVSAVAGEPTTLLARENALRWTMQAQVAPMALAGLGALLSILGIFAVRAREGASQRALLQALFNGVLIASVGIVIGTGVICYFLLGDITGLRWWGVWGAVVVGLVAGIIVGKATEYYTNYDAPPTRSISRAAETGSATVIIGGLAVGMRSVWAAVTTVVVAILAAFVLTGGLEQIVLGLYGVAMAAVGMLSTLGITLATDAYGPIADNAGGNAEMSGLPASTRQRTDALDSLGNTTAATGKGFAIGSAALTALALLGGYVTEVRNATNRQVLQEIRANYTTANAGDIVYLGHRVLGWVREDRDGQRSAEALLVLAPQQLDALAPGTRFVGDPASADPEGHFTVRPADGAGPVLSVVRGPHASVFDIATFHHVTLVNPRVLGGVMLGVMLVFLFCALTMEGVGRAAGRMMRECRRQFQCIRQAMRNAGASDDDIRDPNRWPTSVTLEGHTYPDYASCVAISTAGAQREMIFPSLLAIIAPILVGLFLGVGGTMGLLAGALACGFGVAIFMANAGGAWDNAKKLIETFDRNTTAERFLADPANRERFPELVARAEQLVAEGRGHEVITGKGSEDHKAAVVGDTVGDPCKDTSGPSLNILIKLMSMVSLVFAGAVLKLGPHVAAAVGLR